MENHNLDKIRNQTWDFILHYLLEEIRDITEIETNGTTSLFIKQRGKRIEIENVFKDEQDYVNKTWELVHLIRYKHENETDPYPQFIAEGRLKLDTGETARVHIVLPPAAYEPQVTIAKKSNSLSTLEAIKNTGSMTQEMMNFIIALVDCNKTIVLSGGTGAGKALHKDTLIPTPKGFFTVEELTVGDTIYDEDKEPTNIVAKYQPKTLDHYKITFDNGEIVLACGDHLWKTNSGLYGSDIVINTRTIFEDMELGSKFTVNKAQKEFQDDVYYIEKIEEYEDRPEDYYCFTVDSPSHLFLCTESYIPTHNTTMLEAMSKYFSFQDRIAVVEDLPELKFIQPNVTYTHSTVWSPGMNKNNVATLSWCVQQVNRARTDKIVIGETRGGEFADFITASNSGMEGSITTIHANDPIRALEKMGQFVLVGMPQPVRSAQRSIANSVDIIIQLGFSKYGKNITKEIVAVSRTLGNDDSATIATQPIFTYDSDVDDWKYTGYLPTEIRKSLEENGYNIDTFTKNAQSSDKIFGRPDSTSKEEKSKSMLNTLKFGRKDK